MGLPSKLFSWNTFVNGDSFLGIAEEITTPKLSRKTEDYQGAGMPMGVSIHLGFEAGAADMEITLGGLDARLLKTYGATIDGVQLRFAGSYLDDTTGLSIPCEIQTRGRVQEMDWGSAKQGDNTSHKYTLKNTYVKITINNEEAFELDALNMVWKVDGVDKLEEHRKNIGL
ncbi:phage major tail tube protein [Erwinia rhapontici]|uniref:phage major tail tube protein n=1 Tax=Erwinia TaxID=551 RepID=UPI0014385F43|nr:MULTISPECIES: phage major tail tube protein [Erwinia]NKG32836.1 phage major tail tube protein [Erwinia rhapontici]NNS09307.1 phage major tail tube protein [Erwinia sp. JH02]UDQ80142.1 phage major tail tube protein [Erwinia rhapontici]